MDYNEQAINDFYDRYGAYVAQSGLNATISGAIFEPIKAWFVQGHLCGATLNTAGLKNCVSLLRQYGGHKSTCPSFTLYPAECICGWEQVISDLNKGLQ